jgi:excisionase family DNA binding protein
MSMSNALGESLRLHQESKPVLYGMRRNNLMNDLLTVLEVMSYLKVCRATVQRWCKEGKLPAVKIGKEYRIRRSDLEHWYESLLKEHEPVEAMSR